MDDVSRDKSEKVIPEEISILESETRNSERLQKSSETSEYDAPDGGYGWVIVAVSFLAITVVDGVINSFGIFLSEFVKEFKVSEGKIAWVGSILAGVPLLVGPIASVLTNKFGCRTTCAIGSLITSAALSLSVFCTNVPLLMTTYCGAGIGLGLILLPSIVFVGYYFESKRALATGISLSGSGFGTIIFPPLVNHLLHIYDWRVANLSLAASALCCTLFGLLMKPLKYKPVTDNYFPVKSQLKKNEESKSAVDVSIPTKAKSRLYKHRNSHTLGERRHRSQSNVAEYYEFTRKNLMLLRKELCYSGTLIQNNIPRPRNPTNTSNDNLLIDLDLLKDRNFLLFGLGNIFAMISFYIPLIYMVDYAKTKNIQAGQASFLISVIGIVNTVARIIFGYIVNFPMIDSVFVNNIFLIIGAVSVGLMPYCQSYIAYIFSSFFFGLSIAAYSALTPIILVDLLGIGKLTNGFGIIQLFRGIATLLGAPMAGVLLDLTHSYKIPFLVGGGLFLLSAIFGFILQYAQRKSSVINIDTESVT
ncbi:unnamed protein product [Psylliodes chrysocephalus]|uniref:Major facilitator superfamily (MFS) profile domain-containing protein n=1 Tax=Psylliodes chrysocephalus TaxID=3402493 RepID=A0A9P0GB68_9CUCU|nr:unnamed protein product [Psylliodes chrysocephala]